MLEVLPNPPLFLSPLHQIHSRATAELAHLSPSSQISPTRTPPCIPVFLQWPRPGSSQTAAALVLGTQPGSDLKPSSRPLTGLSLSPTHGHEPLCPLQLLCSRHLPTSGKAVLVVFYEMTLATLPCPLPHHPHRAVADGHSPSCKDASVPTLMTSCTGAGPVSPVGVSPTRSTVPGAWQRERACSG